MPVSGCRRSLFVVQNGSDPDWGTRTRSVRLAAKHLPEVRAGKRHDLIGANVRLGYDRMTNESALGLSIRFADLTCAPCVSRIAMV